jgi:hypothetical protein
LRAHLLEGGFGVLLLIDVEMIELVLVEDDDLGARALRARKPTSLDFIFMSLSVRDLSPEIVVLEVPDMLPNAIAPTPSTDMVRSSVMSARARLVMSVSMPHTPARAAGRNVLIFMGSPDE